MIFNVAGCTKPTKYYEKSWLIFAAAVIVGTLTLEILWLERRKRSQQKMATARICYFTWSILAGTMGLLVASSLEGQAESTLIIGLITASLLSTLASILIGMIRKRIFMEYIKGK